MQMKVYRGSKNSSTGGTLLDKAIDWLPFELHVPGYQYCGPGTELEKRLKRGDKGINPLDSACRKHDIVYSQYKGGSERREADRVLGEEAWNRVTASNATIGEKAAALAVSGAMKAKTALGFGISKPKSKPKRRSKKAKRKISAKNVLKRAIRSASVKINEASPSSLADATKIGLSAAAAIIREHKIPKVKLVEDIAPRVIPVPKIGGFIPLVPLFAGISALGTLIGGASSIVRAVKATKHANDNLVEMSRHNKTMEDIALGKTKTGDGLYLRPYKSGMGLYVKPFDGFGIEKSSKQKQRKLNTKN